jgi:hypothetical protein
MPPLTSRIPRRRRPQPFPKMPPPTLQALPADVLARILGLLAASPRSIAALAAAHPALAAAVRPFAAGVAAFGVRLTLRRAAAALDVREHADRRALRLRKTSLPAHAHAVLGVPLAGYGVHWTVCLRRFAGRSVEVGVTAAPDGRFVDGERSVFFDCAGRLGLGGRRQVTYGRALCEGESVTVVYDPRERALLFLDRGVAMGPPVLLAMVAGVAGAAELWPYVKFGNVPGECVEVSSVGTRALGDVRESYAGWRRPVGCSPVDGCVVVVTWHESVWYAVRVDPRVATLAGLRAELARRTGLPPQSMDLIMDRRRLCGEGETLEELGVFIDASTGSHKYDVLLSVPHLVS